MKTKEMAMRGLYLGTGAGLILFVLIGLLPGSLVGGVIGLKIAGSIFGTPVGGAVLARVIVAVSMITGILVSAVICILGPGLLGWTLGFWVDAVESRKITEAEALQKVHK